MVKKEEVIKEFTKINGVSKAKAELLYNKGFNSLDKLKKATVKDLEKIKGITKTNAKDIQDHFKEEKKVAKTKPLKKEEIEKPTEKKEEKIKVEKKEKTKVKPEKKEEEPKKPEEEEEEKKLEEEEYKVKKKPELSKDQKERLRLRKQIKNRTPEFLREEWFRYKRIKRQWRKPDGMTSKMRINLNYRPSRVKVGFRGPKETRGLHPSGFKEVIVYNVKDLERIDPKFQAARIGGTVGTKKRMVIEKKAEELEVRILNI